MTEQQLDGAHIRALLEQVNCEAMAPHRVRGTALSFLDNFRLANHQGSLCVPEHLRLRKASHRNHCDVVRLFRVRELPGRFNKFLYQ
jgi:hypothetical protein